MPSDERRVVFKHLRAHAGHHVMTCTKSWFVQAGIDFKTFLREGFLADELIENCHPGRREELDALLGFVDENGLWDTAQLEDFLEGQ